MTRQIKATQFSLLVHAMFFCAAVTISQHTSPVRLPVALDFSILPSSGPSEAGPPQAAKASPPALHPPAPVKKKSMPKPVAKKPPPPVMKKKPAEKKKSPVETVPVAASSPQTQPQKTLPQASASSNATAGTVAGATASTNSTHGGGARGGGGGIYAVGQLDGSLAAVAKAPPVYPPAAKRRNIEGWIKVKFVVDEQGQVGRVSVLDAEPEGVFEQAVLRCISGWRFRPGTRGGMAVKALVEQTITFKLE